MARTLIRFGRFRLDLVNLCLWSDDEVCELAPKTFELLRYLAEHPGRLLTKQELLDAVWPGRFVSESVLKAQVARLRKVVGDEWVLTEPRRGYRFSSEVHGGYLPAVLSRCFGREDDLERLGAAVAAHRLVSLVGTGGCGKTRLALELVTRTDRFSGAVHWVELADVTSGELVASQVARTLGARGGEDGEPLEILAGALGDLAQLLVLDNCENLLDPCAALVHELLARCRNLHVLATSREALRVEGEVVFPVAPLAVPAPGDRSEIPTDGPRLAANPAVALFLDRLVVGGLRATPSDAELRMTASICRRLDGLPLALELAAARVPSLGLEAVSSGLDDAPSLLREGRRSDPARHRTLGGAIGWSYDSLDPASRDLFARLSVFRGGFDAARVRRVCAPHLPPAEALDLLGRLVTRSLVVATPRTVSVRYRLLEPVRQVAATYLGADDAAVAEVRRRHAEWCLALAAEAEPQLRGGDRGRALERLDLELGNLRAAMERDDLPAELGSVALRLSTRLVWYWFHRGLWLEGRRALVRGLASGRESEPSWLARAAEALGRIDFFRGAYRESFDQLALARAALADLGDTARAAEAASFGSQCALALDDGAAARRLAADSVAEIRGLGDPWRLGIFLVHEGNVERHLGDLDAAAARYGESVSIFRTLSDDWALGMAFRNLAILHARRGAWERSFEDLRRSLRHLRVGGERWFVARGLEEMAANLVARDRSVEAARLFGAAEGLRRTIGAPLVPFYRADYDRAVDTLRSSLPSWRREWQAGEALGLESALDYALGLT